MPAREPLRVLLVEDSEDDLFFFRRLWSKTGIDARVDFANNGQQAITFFAQALDAASPERPALPQLVFLDLKLPLKNGFDVLEWIRGQAALAKVVIMVLSSSGEASDVTRAFALGADGYLVKYPPASVLREVAELAHSVDSPDARAHLRLPGLPRSA